MALVSVLGAGGRAFKSPRPDQNQQLTLWISENIPPKGPKSASGGIFAGAVLTSCTALPHEQFPNWKIRACLSMAALACGGERNREGSPPPCTDDEWHVQTGAFSPEACLAVPMRVL